MERKARRHDRGFVCRRHPKTRSASGLGVEPQHAGFVLWVILFVGLSTLLNVRGIKMDGSRESYSDCGDVLVIAIFVVDAVHSFG